MTLRLRRLVAVVSVASLVVAAAAFASSPTRSPDSRVSPPWKRGFAAVQTKPCARTELQYVTSKTPRTTIRVRSSVPGQVNTRKTARKIRLHTLLVVNIKHHGTWQLTTGKSCWDHFASHIKHGIMMVAFVMTRAGYAEMTSLRTAPAGAEAGGRSVVFHVLRK